MCHARAIERKAKAARSNGSHWPCSLSGKSGSPEAGPLKPRGNRAALELGIHVYVGNGPVTAVWFGHPGCACFVLPGGSPEVATSHGMGVIGISSIQANLLDKTTLIMFS